MMLESTHTDINSVFAGLNDALSRANESPLSPLEREIITAAWQQQTYSDLATGLYLSEGHVRDVAAALWQKLSQGLQQRVTKKTLRRVVEQTTALPTSTHNRSNHVPVCDWGDAPAVEFFVGRQQQLVELHQQVVERQCRVLALVGMGGVGKTSLMVKLAEAVHTNFEAVVWRSLLNAPSLERLLQDILSVLKPQAAVPSAISREPSSEFATDEFATDALDANSNRLFSHLRHHRCLILLDNAETVLSPISAASGDNDRTLRHHAYGRFFHQMSTVGHCSTLIFTSRELPAAVAHLSGRDRPVQTVQLKGLEAASSRQVLQHAAELTGTDPQWRSLEALYQGHPLALELAARHIETVYFGQVGAFLAANQPLFHGLKDLLAWHIERLTAVEHEIATWLAIYREPMGVGDLQQCFLHPQTQRLIPQTLQDLGRRLPLISTQQRFTLPPVLIDYLSDRLIQQYAQAIQQSDGPVLERFSLMQTTVPDYVRSAQRRVLLTPVLQYSRATFADRSAYLWHLFEILTQFKSPELSGYGAGNIINLLMHAGADLRHRDFSGLVLRQVDFQGTELWHSNFAKVTFDRVRFTQIFKGVMAIATGIAAGRIAVSDSDGMIHLYQARTGQPVMTLDGGDRHWIYGLAFSPAGNRLLSSGTAKIMRLWHSLSGELLNQFSLPCQSFAVAYHPDGAQFAWAGSDTQIYLQGLEGPGPAAVLSGHQGWVWAIAVSPDGTWLASGSDDTTVRIWQWQTGQMQQVCAAHRAAVRTIAIAPNGELLASGSDDGTIKLWCPTSGELLTSLIGHGQIVRSLAFQSDHRLVSAGYDGAIKLWDTTAYRCIKTLHQPGTTRLDAIAIAASEGSEASEDSIDFKQSNLLVAGGKDQVLQLWDLASGRCLKTLQGFVCGTKSLAFSPNGQCLASSGLDHSIWLWDWQTGACRQQLKGHRSNVWSIAISPDGRWLVSGSYDRTIRVWALETGTCVQVWSGHSNFVRSVAFSPLGNCVVSASSDGTLKLWHLHSDRAQQTLRGHRSWVQQGVFTPDGTTVISGGNDGVIRLWETETGRLIQALNSPSSDGVYITAIAHHPTQPYLVSGDSGGSLTLWDVATAKRLKTWLAHHQYIWSVAFSPSGDRMASSGADSTVCLWNSLTQGLHQRIPHPVAVGGLSFSPDGRSLVCGCFDRHIYSYALATAAPQRTLIVPRPCEQMKIPSINGLSSGQVSQLRHLGATLTP